MSEIGPVSHHHVPANGRATQRPSPPAAPAATPRLGDDSVEVSPTARLLGQLARINPVEVQVDKVATARELINAGFYDQPEVLDAAIDGLVNDLAE